MKRAFLLIVVPALLVALGFAQTPAASINTDQTIKGCLSGSDGNYTVLGDSTGHIFKITTNSVDFKQHLDHDVTLIGHRATGASPAAVDNSFAVTELNMISEHCTVAAAAPIAAASTPSETVSTPPASATAPVVATTSTVAENSISPAPAATPTAETVVTPTATAAPAAEIVVSPAATAAPTAEGVVQPAATVSTPSESARTPALRPRRRSETMPAVTTAPDVTASTSSETAGTPPAVATPPTAATSSSSEGASTPPAPAAPPTAPSRGWSVSFLIAFAVLVIVIGTMAPVFSRWRKRKLLEQTGTQNLSFNREESSDKNKSDQAGPRKAA